MTDTSSACPSAGQLNALLDGRLTDAELQSTQQHVDQCPQCQNRLESLVAGTESWDAAVGRVREGERQQENTIFSEAMRRIKSEEFAHLGGNSGKSRSNPLDYLSPSDQPDSLGRLGPYEVTQVIGQGGMGIVLKAHDPSLHRVVAVKILAPHLAHNSNARKRFVREAQAIAAVIHDHVITIHAIDESTEQPKIVMQFISGQSLQQKIDTAGSLDLKEILRIGMQTASGLAAAHAQGLVHRDVKPSNILLENGIQRVKLTDFGLARAVDDASLTQSGVIAGTPQYMAPEQANGDAVDHRADLFSLGSVMYSMCVGHSPFRASTTMGVLKRVCHDPPRPIQEINPDIPVWLSSIIMKLLAKRPDDRFQSAREVAELLERWLAHVQQPIATSRPVVPIELSPPQGQAASHPNRPIWLPHQFAWPLSNRVILALIVLVLLPLGFARSLLLALMAWGLISLWRHFVPRLSAWWHKADESKTFGEAVSFDAAGSAKARGADRQSFASFTQGAKEFGTKWTRAVPEIHLWDTADRRRNLLFAGWCLAGWLDLMCAFFWFTALKPDMVLLLAPISIAMSSVSLLVAHAILRQQNSSVVTRGALCGMLPFSPGTVLRLPLAITTLVWLQRDEVKESFATTPWPESELGKLIHHGRRLIGNWTATGFRVSIWTLAYFVILTMAYVFYQVPYGPSEYHIHNVYSGQLKGSPEILGDDKVPLSIRATGNGPAIGLVPAMKTYRRREALIRIAKKVTHDIEVTDEIRDKLTGDDITETDCIAWFNAVLKTPDASYGKSLFRMLSDLRDNGGFSTRSLPAELPQPSTLSDYLSRWSESLRPRLSNPRGVYRIGSLLDPQLFDSSSHETLFAYSHTSVPWCLGWIAVAFCGWLYGTWRIIAGRHFRRRITAPPVPATA